MTTSARTNTEQIVD